MAITRFTENMMAKFPSWMQMAKDADSIGAQFLDVFGITLNEFKQEMDEVVENFYIETAHTDMIDLLYKIPLSSPTILDMESIDYVNLEHHDGYTQMVFSSRNLRDFYHRQAALPKFYVDRPSGYLYLRVDLEQIADVNNPFQAVIVNNAPQYETLLHHVWNAFDEFALLLGLHRLPGERNLQLKNRILDVFENPGGVTTAGIRNGLSRDLGLLREEVQVIPFQDKAFAGELILPDGTPSKKMMGYAKQINDTLKFTWDTMNFGEAYWFSLEQENLGIHYLPHIWDVDTSLFQTEEFRSGIGYGSDLLVSAPVEQASTRAFKAYVGLMGYYEQSENIYPEIAFQYKIYAKGKILQEEYAEQPFSYTVEAAETFDQNYRVIASQDFDYTLRTNFGDSDTFISSTEESLSARNAVHFGKSNEFLHNQKDPVMRVGMRLTTTEDSKSNRVSELKVVWEDTLGTERSYVFNDSDDFLISKSSIINGKPLTSIAKADVSFDAVTGFGLGYGEFMQTVDTTTEWEEGAWLVNDIVVKDGAISLNLDRAAKVYENAFNQ